MISSLFAEKNLSEQSHFQLKSDLLSKQCMVLFAFVIPISTTGTHVVLSLLMLSWFFAGNLREKTRAIWLHPVSRMAIVFFSFFLAGSLYSSAPKEDVLSALGKMNKLLYISFLIPIVKEEKWRRLAFFGFLGAMLLTLVLSMLKVYGGVPIHTRFTEACIFRDHIYTNFMMALASFFVAHYLMQYSKPVFRLALLCFLVTLVYYVFFMSVGRTGQIIFISLWVLFFLQRFKWKGNGLGFVGLCCLLALASMNMTPFQDRFVKVAQNIELHQVQKADASLGERLEFLEETWQLAKQNLWFGSGTGSFKENYKHYALSNNLLITENPHNEYLNVFFQLGLFGFLGFLVFLGVLCKNSIRLPEPEKWFVQGIVLAMMVGCLANSWLMDFTSGYLFILMVSLCFGALGSKGKYEHSNAN